MRFADAIRRGKIVCEAYGEDLLCIDFHVHAARPVEDVRELLHMPDKAPGVRVVGSPGAFDLDGMSEAQRRAAEQREEAKP